MSMEYYDYGKRLRQSKYGARGAPLAFSPSNDPSVELWMLADDLAGDDSDAISSWVSKEGNAYDFTQGTGANQPVLKKGANGINGHNVVRFDGTNDYLEYTGSDISSSTRGALIAAVRLNGAIKNLQTILASADTATLNFFMVLEAYWSSTNPNVLYQQKDNDTTAVIYGSTTIAIDTVYIMVLKSNGSAYSARVNGVEQTINVSAGADNGDWFGDTSNRDNFSIGALVASSNFDYLRGDVAEIVLTSKDSETRHESYMAARYGVSLP